MSPSYAMKATITIILLLAFRRVGVAQSFSKAIAQERSLTALQTRVSNLEFNLERLTSEVTRLRDSIRAIKQNDRGPGEIVRSPHPWLTLPPITAHYTWLVNGHRLTDQTDLYSQAQRLEVEAEVLPDIRPILGIYTSVDSTTLQSTVTLIEVGATIGPLTLKYVPASFKSFFIEKWSLNYVTAQPGREGNDVGVIFNIGVGQIPAWTFGFDSITGKPTMSDLNVLSADIGFEFHLKSWFWLQTGAIFGINHDECDQFSIGLGVRYE